MTKQTSMDVPLTEEWLVKVGFKYREPEKRQPFRHYILKFNQKDDYGLFIETTPCGFLNDFGTHVNNESGWFLWIGKDHDFIHVRYIRNQSHIIKIVEGLSGYKWNSENHVYGMVHENNPIEEDKEDE